MPPRVHHVDSKVKNTKGTSLRMIKDLKSEFVPLLIVIVLSIASAVLSVYTPTLFGQLLKQDSVMEMIDFSQIAITGVISINWPVFLTKFGTVLGFYVLASLLSFAGSYVVVFISSRYAYNMRKRVMAKIAKLPLSYFDRVPYGDTLSIGTNDVDNISRNMESIINQLFMGITLFFGSIIAMFIWEWRVALVALVSLPLSFLFVFIISKFSGKEFVKYRKDLGEINGKVEETYAGYKIIKLFNKEADVEASFKETNIKMEKSDQKSQFLSGLIFPTTFFVNNMCYVGIAVVGGIIADAATMITFFTYLNLFTRPIQMIGQIFNVIQSVLASGERIYALLDEEEAVPELSDVITTESDIKGNFEFKNVDFSYVKDKPLIENMNLKVNAGDTVAIVGPTGAGKTTLVNLIMRFYEINNGEILLDGIPTNKYSRETLRGSVGMVLQDTWLFKGTIKENLLYGDPNATEEEIIKACKEAHIYHFIETLPGGFNFMLNEDGNNISQGQRQLLTIARAIISKPKIMILDEATSSVDTRTEQQIQDALDKIMLNKTSFVIAHRLSTIKNAKTIIVMKKGHIIETGSHKELLEKGGFYSELYNAQFSGFNPMKKEEESVLES